MYSQLDAPSVEKTVTLLVTKAPTKILWDPPVAIRVDEALRNGPHGQLNASLLPASPGLFDGALRGGENSPGGDEEEEEDDNTDGGGDAAAAGQRLGPGLGPKGGLGLGGGRGWRGLSDVLITYHSDPLQGAQSCHPGKVHTPTHTHTHTHANTSSH